MPSVSWPLDLISSHFSERTELQLAGKLSSFCLLGITCLSLGLNVSSYHQYWQQFKVFLHINVHTCYIFVIKAHFFTGKARPVSSFVFGFVYLRNSCICSSAFRPSGGLGYVSRQVICICLCGLFTEISIRDSKNNTGSWLSTQDFLSTPYTVVWYL